MTGCGKNHSKSQGLALTKFTQPAEDYTGALSEDKLNDITSTGELALTDDSPAVIWWVPKDQKTTLNEVVSWLKQAKEFKGTIPKN